MDSSRTARAQTEKDYNAIVAENYRHNIPYGMAQGFFFFAGMGLYNFSTIFTYFIYDLTASSQIVGLLGTLTHFFFMASQFYGITAIEHLPLKKGTILRYGLFFRLTWLAIGIIALVFPPAAVVAPIFLIYAVGQLLNGIYILGFFDLMSKVIPIEHRGRYFGLRNAVSLASQAGAGYIAGLLIANFSFRGYAFCFLLAFAVHMIDLLLLARFKEEPAPRTGAKGNLWSKLASVPELLRDDANYRWFCLLRPAAQISTAVAPFFIVYAGQVLPGVEKMLGTFTAANLIAVGAGTYLGGRIADRIGFKKLLEISAVSIGLVFFAAFLARNYYTFLLFFLLYGLVSGWQMLSLDNLNMEFGRPERRPTYIATTNVVSGIILSIAPAVAGYLADRIPFTTIFAATGCLMIAVALVIRRRVVDPRQVEAYRL
ncbi:MAG: MFS transporter [bacterium]|jgi:MFS family permease